MNRNSWARVRHALIPIAFMASLLVVWQLIVSLLHIPEYLFPSPARVAQLVTADGGYLAYHASVTLGEAVLGFVCAIVVGFLLGSAFATSSLLERMVFPVAVASQTIPIVAVAPLVIVWLGNGIASKVAVATLLCFFPVVVNTTRGLKSVTRSQVDLFGVLGATRGQRYLKLQLPASVAFVASGMRITGALAMIGAIVAEYAGAEKGIGYVLVQASYRLDTPLLFAAVISSAIGGWIIFGLCVIVEHAFLKRYRPMETSS